jgi:sarcosine oxidase, subunit gamma
MPDPSRILRRTGNLDGLSGIIIASKLDIQTLPPASRLALRWSPAVGATKPVLAGFDSNIQINQARLSMDRILARLGPDEWLLIAAAADAENLTRDLTTQLGADHYSLVDVSHRSCALEIAGPAAAAVLAAGCSIDLGRDQFPVGAATRTLFAKAEVVLIRGVDKLDPDGRHHPVYRLEFWRSFGRYVHAFLVEAAREHAVT